MKAARLASGDVSPLENDNLKAALAQLVRGTHAGDTAAQNDDPDRACVIRCYSKVGVSCFRRAAFSLEQAPFLSLSIWHDRPYGWDLSDQIEEQVISKFYLIDVG